MKYVVCTFPIALALCLASAAAGETPFPPEHIEFFEREVRPVLAENCYSCHGPETQELGLRLDSRAAVLAGSASGRVVASGDPAVSRLLQVLGHTGDVKMPPSEKLPDSAIAALTHWVEIGLPWPEEAAPATGIPRTMEEKVQHARATHWAFQPFSMPPLPEVQARDWAHTNIDYYLLKALEEAALAPSAPADKRTLLRRVYFDLIGLPPTIEEVVAFEQDERPEAYEDVVDRLLASPQYGERWARYWLDIARYSDTKGYVFQEERNFAFSHTYRDYVIRAFNDDLPYDRFIRHQLAADQMDLGEDTRPLAAMGFLSLGRRFINNVHDITDDRIDVTTRGFLGMTVSCARCHDHKTDPIPIDDYYSLYGVFRSAVEPGELPLLEDPDEDDPQYQDFLKQVQEREQAVADLMTELHTGFITHAREKAADYLLAAHEVRDITEEEPVRALARDRQLLWQLVHRWRAFLADMAASPEPVFSAWVAMAALAADDFEAEAAVLAPQIARRETAFPVNARIARVFEGDPPRTMAEVAERYRRAFQAVDKEWTDLLARQSALAVQQEAAPALPPALNDPEAESVRLVLYAAASPVNVPEGDVFMLSDVPTQGRVRGLRNAVDRVKATHPGRPARAMSLQDGKLFEPYVFLRGKPENKGESVPRQFLAVLSNGERTPFENGSGRIDLANAIASPDNPLTARVMVNRLWMYHFGQALVETTSDFGVRSDPPSHPELLDYLARRFVDDGWSIKKLQREMVLSAAYRQRSEAREDALAVDPENRLLWRQHRQRLDFEAMRDAILAAAGTLDLSVVGGESVDIESTPFSGRRSLYARIDRQNLPAIFRTFDFASPDTHSPKRFRTTVPQQALFMINSPFIAAQARALNNRERVVAAGDERGRVEALYALALQRAPEQDELERALSFVGAQGAEPPEPPAWQHGYGAVDETTRQLQDFTPLPHFTQDSWQGGPELPDPALGWVNLNRNGGHPGDARHAAVRRWTAPRAGAVSIAGILEHGNDQGDGVIGYIISSRRGIVWRDSVYLRKAAARVDGLEVEAGETLDFTVASGASPSFDGFAWQPVVKYAESAGFLAGARHKLEFWAFDEFQGPLPPPLESWEKLAQVILCTNEFLFVD